MHSNKLSLNDTCIQLDKKGQDIEHCKTCRHVQGAIALNIGPSSNTFIW